MKSVYKETKSLKDSEVNEQLNFSSELNLSDAYTLLNIISTLYSTIIDPVYINNNEIYVDFKYKCEFVKEYKEKIKESLKHSFVTIGWSSIVIFLISMFGGKYIIYIFTNDLEVYTIATSGIKLFSYGFLIIGINIFMSGYFTAILDLVDINKRWFMAKDITSDGRSDLEPDGGHACDASKG